MIKTQTPYHLVIGLGASGMSMARFLHSIGTTVVATDMDASKTNEAKALGELGIKTQLGFHDQETFNNAAALVPSPGIPLTSKYIKTACEAGVKLTGELDIFFEHNTLPVIAITGTNGKTTTTTLIGDMLKACGKKPFVGGNIGTPLVEQLMSKETADIIVAEISSFQLDLAQKFSPTVGILLNISEDHLDRYDTFADYEDSKWSLFARQKENNFAVINAAIENAAPRSSRLQSKTLTFSSQNKTDSDCNAKIDSTAVRINFNDTQYEINTQNLPQLSGAHNHENIAAATLACLAAGEDMGDIQEGLKQFKNLPHRVAFVATINTVSFYNDSKATNTDAVIRAIQCFSNRVVLILGGREKGTDFTQLQPIINQKVDTIIAIGESRNKIIQLFTNQCRVIGADDMKTAVAKAYEAAEDNAVVLLSPACASFDMYDNYAHRGEDFMNHVNQLGDN